MATGTCGRRRTGRRTTGRPPLRRRGAVEDPDGDVRREATFTTGKRRAGSPSESGSTALAPSECDSRAMARTMVPALPCNCQPSRSLPRLGPAAPPTLRLQRQPPSLGWQPGGSRVHEPGERTRHEEEMNVRGLDRRDGSDPAGTGAARKRPRFTRRNVGVFVGLLLLNYLIVSLFFSTEQNACRDSLPADIRRAAASRQRRHRHRGGHHRRGDLREVAALPGRGGDRDDELLDRGAGVRGQAGAGRPARGERRRGHSEADEPRDPALAHSSRLSRAGAAPLRRLVLVHAPRRRRGWRHVQLRPCEGRPVRADVGA